MEDKKKLLEEAAYQTFLERGYRDTNIALITKKADMAVGSFYNYYQSKDEIFLQVYIRENERMRRELVEKIDWSRKPMDVVEEMFHYSLQVVLQNRILIEWNSKRVGQQIREYYQSEKGLSGNSFHHFLMNYFRVQLGRANYTDVEAAKILRVYELILYVDYHIKEQDFEDREETIQTFIKYFAKGLFDKK